MTVEHLAAAGIVLHAVILTTPLLDRTQQRAWENLASLFEKAWNTQSKWTFIYNTAQIL